MASYSMIEVLYVRVVVQGPANTRPRPAPRVAGDRHALHESGARDEARGGPTAHHLCMHHVPRLLGERCALVQVITGLATSDATFEATTQLAAEMNKVGLRVRPCMQQREQR